MCSGAGSAARTALEAWLSANPGASVAEIREAAIALTGSVLGTYGDAASTLACDLFDSVMELEGVGVPAAQVYGGVREGAVEGTVRRIAGDVDGTQASLDSFMQAVGQLAERETRLAANATVEGNVERAAKTRAGRGVRYARVPTSAVPCEWCAMLASRGFVYRSAESAEAASHHHCSCTIVPGVKGMTEVAGYDTAHYKDVWKHREKYESAGRPQVDNRMEYDVDPIAASLDYFTQDDELRNRVKLMAPEPGYEDFEDIGIHCDGMTFGYQHLGADERPNTWDSISITVADLARSIKDNPSYHGGPVRLASCSAGRYPDGPAKRLANELGAPVRAADMDVWIRDDGWYTLAETKQEAADIYEGLCEPSGNWRTFYPDRWEGKRYES